MPDLIDNILSIDTENTTPESLINEVSTVLCSEGIEHSFVKIHSQDIASNPEIASGNAEVVTLSKVCHLIISDHSLNPTHYQRLKTLLIGMYQYVLHSDMLEASNQLQISERSLDSDRSINPYTVELMADKAKIGTWTLDLNNQELYWSKGVRVIHAVSDDYIPDVATAINYYKEGWSRDRIAECVEHGIETGEPWDEELIIVDANGEEKWVRALGRAFKIGESQVLSGIFQDISNHKKLIANLEELNRLEEEKSRRLKLAVQSAKIGFWDLSIESNILSWDQGMFDIYGVQPENFNGQFEDWSKHVHVDDLDTAVASFESTLQGDEIFDAGFRIIDASTGEEKIIKANAQVIRDNTGSAIRMVGVNYDMTEQALYAKKQEELAQLAHEASQAKSQFLASMSHEIRTPLNGVIGMLGLLKQEDLDEHVMTKLEVADKSAHSLLTLINDVLDLSKIEDGKMEIEKVDFSLEESINFITDMYRYQLEDKGLAFNIKKDYAKEVMITSDPVRLRQIIVNLLSNAFKFTEKGQISLTVKLVKKQPVDQLKIVVTDTGIGIPDELHEKLFQRFTQADSSTTRKFGGTGLGLAITKNLVELLDGKIRLQSEVGFGTTFSIVLPVSVNEAITYETSTEIKQVESPADKDVPPELGHILVVEDNKVNQMVINAQLKKHCDALTIAVNGQEAVDYLIDNEDTYDMILMDCEMPVMDGYEATKMIRNGKAGKSNHAIPIIALTAKAYEEDREKCYSVGMNGFVSKPINVDHLLEEMYRLL